MSDEPSLSTDDIQTDQSLDDLKLKYARTMMYYESIEIQRKHYESHKFRSRVLIYDITAIAIFLMIPICFLIFPLEAALFFSLILSFYLLVNIAILQSVRAGIKKLLKTKNDLLSELVDYESKIFEIIEANSLNPIPTRMKQLYLSSIDLKSEIRKNFTEHCNELIMIDFYNIPLCFERYREIAYDVEIYDKYSGIPIYAEGEVLNKFRKDIKFSLYYMPEYDSSSVCVIPKTPSWGTLYITNYRFIILRKPSLKSSADTTECNEELYLWSKRWKNEGKYEGISIPYKSMGNWNDTGFFKGKKVSIFLNTVDNKFQMDMICRLSNRSIINYLKEIKDMKN
jgi:hypothetical protein